ncbi:MAG: protein-disulfide reductase DsbD domain-containing protein [Luteolibacter sp.]
MKFLVPLASAVLIANASADDPMAKAEWISAQSEISQGKAVQTIIRMTVDDGWHTYWENPGEGGMEISIKADLPEGWSIGELQYPVPKRFMTGELPGFGYEGEIDFPLTLTPPADAAGKMPPLRVKLSWLTCNDNSCVPGDAALELPAQTDAVAVARAYENLPRPLPNATLAADFTDETALLFLSIPEDAEINPAACEVFPVTANVIDAGAKPQFQKQEGNSRVWISTAAKSEYLSEKKPSLEILLVAPNKKSWIITTE